MAKVGAKKYESDKRMAFTASIYKEERDIIDEAQELKIGVSEWVRKKIRTDLKNEIKKIRLERETRREEISAKPKAKKKAKASGKVASA